MGATDSSTVAITIQVRDDGSIGLLDATTAKLVSMNAAGVGTTRSLRDLGTSGFGSISNYSGTAGQGMATFAEQANGALGSVHGNMREVSGTAREFGLNMGYSMRHWLAETPAVMGALRAMSGLFIGLAAVEIFTRVAEGAVQFYEKVFDVTKALEAYQTKAGETAQQKLFDTGSLETAISLMQQAGAEVDRLQQKKHAAGADQRGGGFMQHLVLGAEGEAAIQMGEEYIPAPPAYTTRDDERSAQAQQNLATAQQHTDALHHQSAVETQKAAEAYNSTALTGYAKIEAEERGRITNAQMQLAYTKEQEQGLQKIAEATLALQKAQGVSPDKQIQVYHADPNAGNAQYDQAVAMAAATASGAKVAMARTEQEEIIAAQNKAIDAGARGEVLYAEQRQQAIDAVDRKYQHSQISWQGQLAVTAAIDQEFHNAKMKRLEEEQYQTARIQQEAAQTGHTGIAKIQDEGQQQIRDLTEDPAKQGTRDLLGAEGIGQRVAAIKATTDARILEAHKQFQKEMDQITMRSDQAQEVGYARIEAGAEGMLARIKEDFATTYGQLATADPARIAGTQKEEADISNVMQTALRERQQMTERDNQEIARMNSQTAQAYLPPWLAAQQRIRDQFDETAMKAKADLDAQLAYFKQVADRQGALTTEQAAAQDQVWNQYYNRVTAEAARASAEMEKEQEQTRDKLAGALTSLFDNPAKYMEQRGKQLMMDILANWVMQLTEAKGPMGSAMAWVFGMNPEMSTSTNPKTALGSIFGSHSSTAAHGAAGVGQGSTLATAGSSLTSASSTLNAAGATLSSSGTGLLSAAEALSFAADHIATIAAAGGAGGGGGGSFGMGGGGDFGDTLGSVGGFGGGGGGFQSSDINVAPTGASGVMGVPPGAGAVGQGTAELTSLLSGGGAGSTASLMSGGAHALGGTAGGGASLLTTLAGGGVFGSGVQNFMRGGTGTPSAGMSLPSMSVLGGSTGAGGDMSGVNPAPGEHVVADTTSQGDAVPADSGVQGGSSGIGVMGVAGAGMAALSGGMAMAQDWQSGNTGAAVLTGAMTGASIGSLAGPIGMGIGAVAGALIGFIGSLFGDQGAHKAWIYDQQQVKPAISKEMVSYTAGQMGYDQGLQDMTMLQLKAQTDTKKMGSGAVGVYNRTIAPEINLAISEMQRQQDTGRSQDITMQAAQYDSGGPITHFGDFSTGPFSGFIHARVGETMMNPMASMVHGPTLDAMNRGADIGRGRSTGMGASNGGGGGGELHLHIHALDVADFRSYLRSGAAREIQAALNSNVNSYAGRALG